MPNGERYPEQRHGYMNCEYHCLVCQKTYNPVTKKWKDMSTWKAIERRGVASGPKTLTSGIFHERCIETYLTEYIGTSVPENVKTEITGKLEDRLKRLKKRCGECK